MNLLLTYYHFEDDWKDEKSLKELRESISIKSRQRKSVRNIQGRAVSSVRDYESLPYMNKKERQILTL